ncbi:MAG: ComEC/Rec2 family competence protein [Rhodospirillales bacterium]|jgi:competence protein ComEC|nr:ComEC/Rec2 family competence protein [Rhodospirillales bacterium]MDP7650216.1 ComEC/Rec2 family competence protein [Rhodospirillales bacterium]
MAVSTAFGWLGRRRAVPLVAALGVGVLALGFAAAQWRTVAVQTPVLDHRLGPTNVAGRVVGVEVLPGASRVTLERLRIGQLSPARTPERLRVRLGGKQPRIIPGDWIRVRAILSPPPPPAAPGAFDFQRQSYFRQLGAVGFSLGSATVEEHHRAEGFAAFGFALERLRQRISERVVAGIDGTPGAIAAALMTGSRGAISAEVMANIRDSGLAHLLAISGLHIGLVAGIVFFGLRGALALVPPLALRYPIKKWAAMAAIAGAFAYALVAGATVPTQRAFLMIGLVLLAVLFDRRGLSMRLVAWAAFAILLFRPESLLGASFQMSFAAVVALVAVYEVVRDRRRLDEAGPPSWPRRALHYLGGVGLTTLIAGSATAPFAIYHFNRFAVFGLAANLVAVPVTALWIMPWAVAAFLLMPFGLESVALAPMGLGIEVVVRVAETVAAWPGAVTLVPAMPVWGLAALGLGGLWLCLWRCPWRAWGLAGVAAGLAGVAVTVPPDVLVDGGGRLMAVRSASGTFAVSTRRTGRFNRGVWLRRVGQDAEAPLWPRQGFSADGRLVCDHLGCILHAKKHVVALVSRPQSLAEDCWIADVVVSAVPVRGPCPAADRFDLWRHGAHALWLLDNGQVRVESVNEERGRRPWVVRPAPRQRSDSAS